MFELWLSACGDPILLREPTGDERAEQVEAGAILVAIICADSWEDAYRQADEVMGATVEG